MTDTEHPIDMIDDKPEGDAVEQSQTAGDSGPVTGSAPEEAEPADVAEQRTAASG